MNNQIGFTTSPQRLALHALRHRHHAHARDPRVPRERRGPRGGGPGHAARRRVPAAVAGRRHRRLATASTATTRATSRPSRSRSCTRSSPPRPPSRGSTPPSSQRDGVVTEEQVAGMTRAYQARARGGLPGAAAVAAVPRPSRDRRHLDAYHGGPLTARRGGRDRVPAERLADSPAHLAELPAGFDAEPEDRQALRGPRRDGPRQAPARLGHRRAARVRDPRLGGHAVRLAGQDSRRGTFSHRHADALRRHRNGAPYTPLAKLARGAGEVRGLRQPALRAGRARFDYGYSLEQPEASSSGRRSSATS